MIGGLAASAIQLSMHVQQVVAQFMQGVPREPRGERSCGSG